MSEGKKSLIHLEDLAGLSKIGVALVDMISGGVSKLYEPVHTRRVAKAEAEAKEIATFGDINVERIRTRLVGTALYEQKNLETIALKAAQYLTDKAKPSEISPDWQYAFIDKAKGSSDSDVQEVWARILKGEAEKPGTFSKRTLDFLHKCDRSDVEIFQRLCSFVCEFDDYPIPLITGEQHKIYRHNQIMSEDIAHLCSIGLIQYTALVGYGGLPSHAHPILPSSSGREVAIPVKYQDRHIHVSIGGEEIKDLQAREIEIQTGSVLFTSMGRELYPLCDTQPISGFVEHLFEYWDKFKPSYPRPL